jgi:hypothetical protein
MKRLLKVALLTLIVAATAPPTKAGTVQAGKAGQDEPRYDTSTVATFTGIVGAVSLHTGRRGNPRTRAMLKTKDGIVQIHIGPTSFLQDRQVEIAEGDSLTVIGSRVSEDSGELIIVRQLTRGKQVLMLRNEDGRPLWDERFK